MIGFDVSEFQTPGGVPYGDFAIVRAANGRRYDNKWQGHVQAARNHGVPFSLYIYNEPGSTSPEYQGDMLATVANEAGLSQGTTLWADIEEGSGDLRWFEDRVVGRVNAHGYQCGVYSGDYFWGAHNLAGDQGRWKATYGPNDGRQHNAPSGPFDIWQFTSNPLDTNTADAETVGRLFGASYAPPKKKATTGVQGMLCRDRDNGAIWLVGPGHVHHIGDGDSVNRLRFVGVPYAGDMAGLEIVAWAQTFGATSIDGQPI